LGEWGIREARWREGKRKPKSELTRGISPKGGEAMNGGHLARCGRRCSEAKLWQTKLPLFVTGSFRRAIDSQPGDSLGEPRHEERHQERRRTRLVCTASIWQSSRAPRGAL